MFSDHWLPLLSQYLAPPPLVAHHSHSNLYVHLEITISVVKNRREVLSMLKEMYEFRSERPTNLKKYMEFNIGISRGVEVSYKKSLLWGRYRYLMEQHIRK